MISKIIEKLKGIFIPEERDLTEEEQGFRDKFLQAIEDGTIILEEGEKVRQCLIKLFGCRYYNAYWFISNHARLWTVKKKIKLVKPQLAYKVFRKHNETYDLWPDFLRGFYETWEDKALKGKGPHYYYYDNYYPSKLNKCKNKLRCKMQYLVLVYFGTEDDLNNLKRSDTQVHHEDFMDWNKTPYENNRADAIQALRNVKCGESSKKVPEKKQHDWVHQNAKTVTTETFWANYIDAINKGLPRIAGTADALEAWVLAGIQNGNPDAPVGFVVRDDQDKATHTSYHTAKTVVPSETFQDPTGANEGA